MINDVINLAGGLKKDAITTDINLSKKVVNEMVIYISSKSEFNKKTSQNNINNSVQINNNKENETLNNKSVSSEKNNSASTQSTKTSSDNIIISKENKPSTTKNEDNEEKAIVSSETKVSDYNNETANELYIVKEEESNNSLVNINSASLEELQTLPGVGASKAEKIISYREENGPFNTIEDIKNVSGIGDALYEKFKDYITI